MEGDSVNIHKDKGFERIILDKATSTSGKYEIFLGEHLVAGMPCYDICCIRQVGPGHGYLVARHHPSNADPKAKEHAYALWTTFREEMTKPRVGGQDNEPPDPMETIN